MLLLELAPAVESRLRDYAEREGVSIAELIERAFPTAAPVVSRRAPRLQSLSREEASRLQAPSIARLQAQIEDAEKATLEEIAQAEAEWEAHKRAMNDNRRITGERLVYKEDV